MRDRLRLFLASLLGIVAVVVVVRGMLLAMPRAEPTPTVSEIAGYTPRAEPTRTLAIEQLEIEVTPEMLPHVVSGIDDRIAASATTLVRGRLGADDAAVLADNASAYLGTVVGASSDGYVEFLRARGGDPGVDLTVSGNRDLFESFFEELNRPYAHGGVSLDRLEVRPRVLAGRNVPQDDFGLQVGSGHAQKRYPALGAVAYDTPFGQKIVADTYEVLMPVSYRQESSTVVVYLGVWMTRVPEGGGWLPSRIVTYSPSDARDVRLPVF